MGRKPGPQLITEKQRAFIEAYIADPQHNAGDAALKAGYTTRREGQRLLRDEGHVKDHIEQWRRDKIDAVVAVSTINAAEHIAILEDQARGLLAIKAARARAFLHVPGGETGMVVERVRYFGSGDDVRSFKESIVDNGTNKELRETLKQISIMRGEYVEKAENKNIGLGSGQIIITEIVVEAAEHTDAIEAEGRVVE